MCVINKNKPQLAGSSSLFGQLGVPSHTRDCSIQVPETPQVKVVAVHLVGFKAKKKYCQFMPLKLLDNVDDRTGVSN